MSQTKNPTSVELLESLSELSPERRALLAKYLLQVKKRGGEPDRKLTIGRTPLREQTDAFPLSFAQERLWFLDQLMPGSALYNRPVAVRLRGRLDVPALDRTFNEIVRRHEMLRTTFRAEKGHTQQVAAPQARLPLPVTELQGLPEAEREAEAVRLVKEEAWKPFDLSCWPLLRVSLVRLAEDDHMLLVTLHHIVSDGWSLGILIKEFAALYEAFIDGSPSPLPPLPIQYADFAVWQREWLSGETLTGQLDYWRQQLGGPLPVLELFTDRPRPPVQSFRGATLDFEIPRPLLESLKALAQNEDSTLFMVLLSAFAVLLNRYSGQDDILIGSPIAGRNHSEVEPLIGLFINNLVLRADLSGVPSFRELLGRMRQVTLDAYQHSTLPFEKIVEELQPERRLDRQALYQVMFALQNAPMQKIELRDLTLTPFRNETRSEASDDLNLSVIETDRGLWGIMEYNTDIFDSSTVQRLASNFETLLAGIVAAPGESIARLSALSETELQLTAARNATVHEYPADSCVQQLFEAQVGRTPAATALVGEGVELNYEELNRRANRLAHRLRAMGVGADTVVGICAERSVEMVVGVLAVLKAGGAYLPLDPQYPRERLEFMLEDAQVGVLLTQQRLLAGLPLHGARPLCLDSEWPDVEREPAENPPVVTRPDNLAYVIYTSGSTGRPKGVQMTHGPLVNLINWQCRDLPDNETARTLQFASLSFDMSFQEMLSAWSSGGSVVLMSEETRRDGMALLACLRRHGVTRLLLPFVGLQQLAEAVEESGELPEQLREVISAGEQLRITPAVEALFGRLNGCRLYNQYGPSEVHCVTSVRLPERPEEWRRLPPIGRPIWNTQLYVLDEGQRPVPTGVAGEIYIGGTCVSRGFLKRPGLTAEKYLPDPYGRSLGARMYRSGDVGRYLADGQLEVLGRADQQVKIRGYRIELGEVETVLDTHPLVGKSAVVVREDVPGEKRLVGYVVPPPGERATTTSELRRHAQEKLPEYMVPTVFVVIDELPLTPSGKLNRRALPAPDTARPALDAAPVAPRTPAEEALARIWAEVLKLESVGVDDNFLELGGDSILSIQIVSRAKRANLHLTLTDFWQHLTVAEQARVATFEEHASDGAAVKPPADAHAATGADAQASLSRASGDTRFEKLAGAGRRVEDAYKLSPMQQGILFHSIFDQTPGEYVEQFSCTLRGELDVPAFGRAWEYVIRRHPALRSSFAWEELDEPLQIVHDSFELSLEQQDWRALAADEQSARFASFVEAEQRGGSFDLSTAPLMRLFLFRVADDAHYFVWSFHDIVVDGWSAPLILEEVRACYEAFSRGGEPQLAPSYPYRNFLEWLDRQDLRSAETFWRKSLGGVGETARLRFDHDADAAPSGGYDRRHVYLSREDTAALQAAARKHQLTLNTLMQGAWALLLSRFGGRDEVLFGSVVSGRPAELAGVESTAGVFVNTLPVRVRVSHEAALESWLKELQAAQVEARRYEYTPLVQMQKWGGVAAGQRLFESILAYVNYPASREGFWMDEQWSLQKSGYPLFVVVRPGAEMLLEITYSPAQFDGGTITRMLEYLRTLLEAMARDGHRRIAQLPPLSERERELVLSKWNDTATDFPLQTTFQQQFEAQAERTPDAVAVIHEGRRVTYAELNRQANRLARVLDRAGVAPEAVVAILAERGIEFLTAVLAVFKAGAAYLPLDPLYSRQHIAQLLEQSRAALALSTNDLSPLLAAASDELAPGRRPPLLNVEDELARQGEDDADLEARNGPANLAYVIYTSGSTGVPKGAMVEQRGMLNHLHAKIRELRLGGADVVAQTASQCFDISVWQFLAALLVGGRVQVFGDEVAHDPPRLLDGVDAEGVTILETVPSLMRFILEEAARRASARPPLSALRWLIPTGEALPPSLCSRWLDYYSHVPLLNAYGPTECSDDVTHYRLTQPPPPGATNVPIGRPVANMRLYVLDPHGQPAPLKVAGELYVGGVGVGRGYFDDPARTAEVFIPDPFSAEPGARLYRTGDLGRFLEDGDIEFLGRADYQVKIHGYRIELGEIEAALGLHPDVRECAVAALEGTEGDKRLVAYVVPQPGENLTAEALTDFLKVRLPHYMVPASYVTLDALPLTPNGKVDRKALPAHDASDDAQGDAFVAPSGPVEETLAQIWMELLGLEQVGVHDSFFRLGGHSLLATMLFARIRTAFNVELPLRRLFEALTIAGLAVLIEEALLDEIEAPDGAGV